MFGLEGQKKKKPDILNFDLEKDLQDPVKYKQIRQGLEESLQKVKDILRIGDEDPENFNRLILILNGYDSILKVIERVVKKK